MFKKIPLLSLLLLSFSSAEDNKVKDYSMYVSGGSNKSDIKYLFSKNQYYNNLDDKGSVFETGVEYKITPNIFSTLSYQRTAMDEINKDNYFLSVNYQLNDVFLLPYVGVLGGYSDLNDDKYPASVPSGNNLDSSSFLLGLQLGVEHPIDKKFSIFSKYQALKTDHKMDILYDSSIIKNNSNQNIQIGIRYEF